MPQEWGARAEAEAQAMWERFSSPPVVEALGGVLQRLSKRRVQRSAAQHSRL